MRKWSIGRVEGQRRVAVTAMVIGTLWTSTLGLSAVSVRAAPDHVIGYIMGMRAGDASQPPRGEVVAFDANSGRVKADIVRPYRTASPDELVSPRGDRLFLLEGKLSQDGKGETDQLSVVDTQSWRTLASRVVARRFRYPITGPSAMLLSPDGSHLYLHSYRIFQGNRAAFWLSVLDPSSLRILKGRIALPSCGAAQFAIVAGQVVVLCIQATDVRFIDRLTDRVCPAWLSVVRPLGWWSRRITVIDAVSHRVIRYLTTYRQKTQTVPTLGSVAITAGRQLVIGALARPRDATSAFSLRVFSLPSLRLQRVVPLAHYTHFVSAPGGGLYTFSMGDGDAPSQQWGVRWLAPDFGYAGRAVELRGPVFHLELARSTFSNNL